MGDGLLDKAASTLTNAERPQRQGKESHGRDGQILTKTKGQRTISFAIIQSKRTFEMLSRFDKITREPARHAAYPVSDPSFGQVWPTFNVAQELVHQFSHRAQLSSKEACAPQPMESRKSLRHVTHSS